MNRMEPLRDFGWMDASLRERDGCPGEMRPSTISRTYGVNFARHWHVPVKQGKRV